MKQHLKHSHKLTDEVIEEKLNFYLVLAGAPLHEQQTPNLDFLFETMEEPIVASPSRASSEERVEQSTSLTGLNINDNNCVEFENMGYVESPLVSYSKTQSVVSPASTHPPEEMAAFNMTSGRYEAKRTHSGQAPSVKVVLGQAPNQPENTESSLGQAPKEVLPSKRSQRKPAKLILQQTVQCQICSKDITNTSNLRRHYKNSHKLDQDVINERMRDVKSTQMRCPHCQKLFTNKTVHMAHCQEKKKADERNEKRAEKIVADRNGKALKGAVKLIEALEKWAEDRHANLSEQSRKKHVLYSRQFLLFLEEKVPAFVADKLLHLDAPRLMSISQFLLTISSPNMQSHYVAANQFLIKFLIETYQAFDVEDNEHILKTQVLINDLQAQQGINTSRFKPINKEKSLKWAENRQKAQEDENVLELNMERSEEIFFELWESDNLKKVLEEFAKSGAVPEEHIEKPCFMRDLLLALLILFSAGNRQSVPCKMTVGEFEKAKQHEHGFEVSVSNHKTKSTGAARIPFKFPGLYEACVRYKNLYRKNADGNELLFQTENGKEVSGNRTMKVIKHFAYITEAELEKMTTKPWRKLWVKWNVTQSEQEAKRGAKVMRHSRKIQDKNYTVLEPGETTAHADQLLQKVQKSRRKRARSSSSDTPHRAKQRRRSPSESSSEESSLPERALSPEKEKRVADIQDKPWM